MPNPNARRRNATSGFTTLPAARAAVAPPWPGGRPSSRAAQLWQALWASPMASQWIDTDALVVARLVRLTVKAESDTARIGELAELRRLEDCLGLSPSARRSLRWSLPAGEEPDGGSVVRLRGV